MSYYLCIIMNTECTISEYISLQPDYSARILAIEQLIDKMLLSIAEQSGGGSLSGITEYQLDDGQIKIKTAYNSISQVEAGINSLEKLKNIYINRMRGRVTVLRDVNSFAKRR